MSSTTPSDLPVLLAIDVGSSSCRAGLYDVTGGLVPGARGQVAYNPRTTPDGGAELDPSALLAALERVMDQALASGAPVLGRLAGVATTTFWHSLMGLDEAGEPTTPVLLWMDARAREDAQALQAALDGPAIHARTGCRLHWSYWPAKLRWLARTQPDVVARTRRWVSLGEWLGLRLFGEARASLSMVSATGLYDQQADSWDGALLDQLGLAAGALSPVVPLRQVFGGLREPYATRWPALRFQPWLPAVGDGATSNLGADCATPSRAALMIGTSGALRVVAPAPCPALPESLWCYRLDERRLVLGGALNDGGSLLEWLVESLHFATIGEAEHASAAVAPDSHGLTVLPFWAGERSPGWADDARGAILGLRLHSTPGDILRASMEAVAYRFAAVAEALQNLVPDMETVVATGGALLRSPTWLQIMADALRRPVLASAEPEASSRGAALLAAETLGLLDGTPAIEARVPTVAATYLPEPGRAETYAAGRRRLESYYGRLVP